MNPANALSLFHFTKRMDTLKSIIVRGLRFSFAYELYPTEIIKAEEFPSNPEVLNDEFINNGVAIPMISFCDIPITRAAQHIKNYGKCAIGLNKELLIKQFPNLLNPVAYVTSPILREFIIRNSLNQSAEYRKLIDKISSISELQSQKEKNKLYEEFESLSKSYIDSHFLYKIFIGLIKPAYNADTCYYDEREWRIIYPDKNGNAGDWKWSVSKEDYDESKKLWNELLNKSNDFFIKHLSENISEIITHIVVPKETNIDSLIKTILRSKTILGCNDVSYNSRIKIISKISSMERIINDY